MKTKQRVFILVLATFFVASLTLGIIAILRLHVSPNTNPALRPEHLLSLKPNPASDVSILLIGNSMVLENDLPAALKQLAKPDSYDVDIAVAAANGARLVETIRLDEFHAAIAQEWDVIILQDFTKTPLRWFDRIGGRWAIENIVRRTNGSKVLLLPPPPSLPGTQVYSDAGVLTKEPRDPHDYARRTLEYYESLGFPVAPVPDVWLEAVDAGQNLYTEDGHHPNAMGTAVIATAIWQHLRVILASENQTQN